MQSIRGECQQAFTEFTLHFSQAMYAKKCPVSVLTSLLIIHFSSVLASHGYAKSYFLPDLKSNFSGPPPSSMAAGPEAYLQGNIRMTLEEPELWKSFHEIGTEMIITKPGR